jgi:hypothetical protein
MKLELNTKVTTLMVVTDREGREYPVGTPAVIGGLRWGFPVNSSMKWVNA